MLKQYIILLIMFEPFDQLSELSQYLFKIGINAG